MTDKELLNRLRSLPDALEPERDLWPDLERELDRDVQSDIGYELDRQESRSPESVLDESQSQSSIITHESSISFLRLAVAATVLLAAFVAAILLFRSADDLPGEPRWMVEALEGSALPAGLESGELRPGDILTTSGRDRLRASTDIGEVIVEPSSIVQLEQATSDRQVLALNRGEIYARIVAPPRVFIVQTPSVTAIDLGCEYRLGVDEDGFGRLEVFAGWVALDHHGREWYVPAGAAAAIRGDAGPGAPYFVDATDAFRAATERYAASSATSDLEGMIAEARAYDTLTLWHFARDTNRDHRALIFDALLRLGVVPDGFRKADFVDQSPAAAEWLKYHLEEEVWFRPDLFFGSADDLNIRKRKPATPGRVTE